MPFTDTLVLKNNANANVNYLIQGRGVGFSTRIREGDDLTLASILRIQHSIERNNKMKLDVQRSLTSLSIPVLGADNVLYEAKALFVYTCPRVSALTTALKKDSINGISSLLALAGTYDSLLAGAV